MLFSVTLAVSILYATGEPQIRLTGGNGPQEGNVEVLVDQNTWKYICDDGWDMRDAKVVCRELRFAKAVKATKKSFFPQRTSRYRFDFNSTYFATRVLCTGDEQQVRNCETGLQNTQKCYRTYSAAGVVCSNVKDEIQTAPQPPKANGEDIEGVEFRLIGESKHGFISSGYLEVLYDGVWGSVCADGWTKKESYVACGNLGYPDVEERGIFPSTPLSQNKNYFMKNVKCSGMESKLYECGHSGRGKQVCNQDIPVYLNCKRSPLLRDNRFDRALISNHNVRLRSGYRHSEGRVEVKYKGEWGSICDDNWSIQNANVFCRQIGFGTAFLATHEASFGQGSGKVWMDEVKCSGREHSIQQCHHRGWGRTDCGHKEDAGVKCHYPYGEPEAKLRLRGSKDKNKGVVEIMHKGKWKGICGIGWGLKEAGVVCRQLGLGFPIKGISSDRFGIPRGGLAMFNVKCSGDELSVTHCHHVGEDIGRCRYYDVAVVYCSPNAPDLVIDTAELKRTVQVESKSLYWLHCAYEEKCLASDVTEWTMSAHDRNAGYHNRTLIRFTARFWNRGKAEFRSNNEKDVWEWHRCHQHFHSMERFADYDLTDMQGNKVAEGHKASFCLEDYECEKGVKKKYNCGARTPWIRQDQGLQVNCADTYKAHLDCQWIDVTNLLYDHYKLRVVLNPQNLVYESDYSNNIASCDVTHWRKGVITVGECRIHQCEKMSWGGVGDGSCCKFPFVYKGKQYHSCTNDGPHGYLWCATTSNFDKDGLWGRC